MQTITEINCEIERLKAKNTMAREKIANREKQIEDLRARRARLTTPPEPQEDAVMFDKVFAGSPKRFRHAAVRDDRRLWSVTGSTGPTGVSWATLIEFVRRDNTLLSPIVMTLGTSGVLSLGRASR